MNDLSGKEWLLFTKSWFVLNPPPRNLKISHPASFPDEVAASFIEFFTKRGDWILDPFAGSGSSLVAAKECGRNSIGIELYPHFAKLANQRINSVVGGEGVESILIQGDSRELTSLLKATVESPPKLCITSPPYWNQLSHTHRRQLKRKETNLQTNYGLDPLDLGNLKSYRRFIGETTKVFDATYEVMAPNSWLVVVTNNVFQNGKLYPLAFDLFNRLSNKWVPKDERIWCQDNKHLFPFGIFRKWYANRCHHYCFIFRKEVS